MKKQLFRAVFAAAMFALSLPFLTGCDLVRASLGKPTSEDLELLRMAEQARIRAADSVAEQAPAPALEPAVEPEPASVPASPEEGIRQYYVVVGAFRDPAGVQLYADRMKAKDLRFCTLPFKNGTTAICSEGTDDIEEARRLMAAFKEAGFDAWLYNSNQQLHK